MSIHRYGAEREGDASVVTFYTGSQWSAGREGSGWAGFYLPREGVANVETHRIRVPSQFRTQVQNFLTLINQASPKTLAAINQQLVQAAVQRGWIDPAVYFGVRGAREKSHRAVSASPSRPTSAESVPARRASEVYARTAAAAQPADPSAPARFVLRFKAEWASQYEGIEAALEVEARSRVAAGEIQDLVFLGSGHYEFVARDKQAGMLAGRELVRAVKDAGAASAACAPTGGSR